MPFAGARAPAIGIFAAACMVVLARRMPDDGRKPVLSGFEAYADCLGNARPTAVNLKWALAA
jgi:methylthioribose-1-phosphate isomerase